MSQRIQINFRKPDLTAIAELCTDEGPGASGLLSGMLETPFVGRAVHAMYAGPAILVAIPERHGEPRDGRIPAENETDRPRSGDILLLPPADEEDLGRSPHTGRVTVAIFYGDHGRPLTPQGWQAGARVGRVVEGLGALREVCRAIRFEGAREVTLAHEARRGEVEVVGAMLYTDGASLGNPGPAGAGFVLSADDGRVLAEGSIPLDPTTVNVAEYSALLAGLTEALRVGVRRLDLRMDSELVIKQLKGQYRVKARPLVPMFIEAKRLIGRFDAFACRHVPREQNQRADELAGAAAKRAKERWARDAQ